VIGLRQIDELEVEGEGTGELVGLGKLESFHALECVLHWLGARGGTALRSEASGGSSASLLLLLTASDGGEPELFDGLEG